MDDRALIETLAKVADLLDQTAHPWWIIGSAAVALHGAAVAVTRDVDVLVDPRDMPALAAATGVMPQPGVADDRFRSALVLHLTDEPLVLDIFADLRMRAADGWHLLRPQTREPVVAGGAALFVPAARELIDILTQFGREKDLARAKLLRGLG